MAFFCARKRIVALLAAFVMMAVVPEVYTSAIAVAQTNKKGSSKKTSPRRSSKKSNNKTTQKPNNRTTKQPNNPTTQQPKSSEEAKRMQEAAQKEIQQTRERIRMNDEEIKSGLSDLNRLSADIGTGRAKVSDLQKKVARLNAEISSLSEEISKNESELALMRDEYLKAVKKMRLMGKKQSMLAFIFASENFNQAMRRLRYLRQFSAWKSKKSADIDNKISQLSEERTRLSGVKEAQTVALGELNRSQSQLESQYKEQNRLVEGLRQNGDALQKHLVAKQAEANKLKETISTLIARELAKAEAERVAREKAEAERIAREKAEAERVAREKAEAERIAAEKAAAEKAAAEQAAKDKAAQQKKDAEKEKADKKAKKEKEKAEKNRKKNSENGSRNRRDRRAREEEKKKEDSAKPAEQPSVAPAANNSASVSHSSAGKDFASLKGSLPRPVDGGWRITNPFGRHSLPELPEIEYDNPGIDAEVATGASVKAVCGGRVSGVYKVDGYGTVVIVNHGDYYTVYGNLSSANVSVGTQVGSGQALGSAAADPDNPRRGSVHFEVWKGREKQNPAVWLR